MNNYDEPLLLEAVPESNQFRVYRAFAYEIGYLGSGITVNVPEGYLVDLTKVPRLVRFFVPMTGRAAKAALLFDWLMTLGDEDRAHKVFEEALGVAGVAPTTRWLLVKAVRLWSWWKSP